MKNTMEIKCQIFGKKLDGIDAVTLSVMRYSRAYHLSQGHTGNGGHLRRNVRSTIFRLARFAAARGCDAVHYSVGVPQSPYYAAEIEARLIRGGQIVGQTGATATWLDISYRRRAGNVYLHQSHFSSVAVRRALRDGFSRDADYHAPGVIIGQIEITF